MALIALVSGRFVSVGSGLARARVHRSKVANHLGLRADGLVAVVNSRDVAELFEKKHPEVLRNIRDLEIDGNLHTSLFRQVTTPVSVGRDQPSYDMTRDGFMLLVMGWTGEKAMQFKVRYIQAFNAMEATQIAQAQAWCPGATAT